MIYGSVCSGIEAATVAWHPLGWRPAFFAEIDKFPSAVLAHHYPHVSNLGDFTLIQPDQHDAIDVLVGGTPCQDFSVAGLRAGLAGDRGNLTLEFGRLAQRTRPRWLAWENVPGVLSSNGGQDFATVLGLFAGRSVAVPPGGWQSAGIIPGYRNAYGLAYRVLDAQYVRVDGFPRAVPQRRRRVFVVGYLGDWRRAAAVLFELAGLCGDPPPSRQAGQAVAGCLAPGSGGGCGPDDNDARANHLIAGTLQNSGRAAGSATQQDAEAGLLIPLNCLGGASHTLTAKHTATGHLDPDGETWIGGRLGGGIDVAHALRADGFDASEDGTGRGTPLVPVPFDTTQITSKGNYSQPKPGDPCHPLAAGAHPPAIAFDCKASGRNGFGVGEISPTLRAMGHKDGHANAGGQVAVAVNLRHPTELDYSPTLQAGGARQAGGYSQNAIPHVVSAGVRRLMPVECERLQAFPDNYTLIPWRRGWAPDGPRYKALGNSMAVNVMRWIGWRIEMVDALPASALAA